ncbi:small ribosomal subunit protein uS15m [Paroedura picta]|uniref:small ribosomal subunit protein uS15m n=1 Tax=Paroedura picta TaxID=143630 RepID=UPI004055A969
MLRGLATALVRGWNAGTATGIPSKSPLLQTARGYPRAVRKKKTEIPSHLDDIPPTMLMQSYAKVPIIDKVDDVVKRILSLEMASQREKVKIKKEQLAAKVRKNPNDSSSLEVQIAYLTAKIRTMQEHLQKFHKDKKNRRQMLMSMDRRNLLLKTLRNKQYDVFENTCKQLGIEYTLPPLYNRRATQRWLVKKAFCKRVFEEVQKQKALEKLKEKEKNAGAAKDQAVQSLGTPV